MNLGMFFLGGRKLPLAKNGRFPCVDVPVLRDIYFVNFSTACFSQNKDAYIVTETEDRKANGTLSSV